MKKIGLISDTHGFVHPELPRIFKDCDEIWHAGDFGGIETADTLRQIKPLRGVYGNIDDNIVRSEFAEIDRFLCEEVDVMMIHIGGYPGNYRPKVNAIMKTRPPKLFISGHSHILKIMHDKKYDCLHLNPGSAGRQGFHKSITILRFTINGNIISDMEVVEFPKGE
jgi:uncharacterized protein